MVLSPTVMQTEVLKMTDESRGDFVGWPESAPETAANWAAACRAFFTQISAPPINPAIHGAAEQAFIAASVGTISVPGGGAAALDLGFQVYAATMIAGVIPPAIAIPPVVPPLLATVLIAPVPSAQGVAVTLGAKIYTWAITGTFTVPPAPAVLPWL